MCGRYQRRSDKQKIAEAFHLGDLDELILELAPDYNIAPTTRQPVIVADRETGDRSLRIMRWGLIPFWCKDLKKLGLSTINTQAESITQKPMWRRPFSKRRCLVVADGFYEWQKLDAKTKQPYAIALAGGGFMALAGLWENWKSPAGEWVRSFTIITTTPNELCGQIHNRMPVILPPKEWPLWLGEDAAEPEQLKAVLRPYPADDMTCWPVSARVGNVKNNDPSLIEPVTV
jgi:putative SOS response-associated peptidase YedK